MFPLVLLGSSVLCPASLGPVAWHGAEPCRMTHRPMNRRTNEYSNEYSYAIAYDWLVTQHYRRHSWLIHGPWRDKVHGTWGRVDLFLWSSTPVVLQHMGLNRTRIKELRTKTSNKQLQNCLKKRFKEGIDESMKINPFKYRSVLIQSHWMIHTQSM